MGHGEGEDGVQANPSANSSCPRLSGFRYCILNPELHNPEPCNPEPESRKLFGAPEIEAFYNTLNPVSPKPLTQEVAGQWRRECLEGDLRPLWADHLDAHRHVLGIRV